MGDTNLNPTRLRDPRSDFPISEPIACISNGHSGRPVRHYGLCAIDAAFGLIYFASFGIERKEALA
jgi:hypothetical protein